LTGLLEYAGRYFEMIFLKNNYKVLSASRLKYFGYRKTRQLKFIKFPSVQSIIELEILI